MDIREIAQRTVDFLPALEAAKTQINPSTFRWYPYDSLGTFYTLDEVLTAGNRRLLELVGGEPVLDCGCGDGDISFFLESLGCQVDAIDHAPTNYNGMRGVWSLKSVLHSAVEIHNLDVDSQFELPRERYGAAFFFGVLYHLKNPFYALEKLARHSRYCFLSTRIGAWTPDRRIDFHDAPLAYLLGPGEANYDATNYWIFSDASLRRLLDRTHWDVCDYKIIGHGPESGPADGQSDARVLCLARSRLFDRLGTAEFLRGWHRLEENSWRWTERRFTARFPNPPPGPAVRLRLHLAIPEPLIQRLGPLRLSAVVNGSILKPEAYPESGEHRYEREIDAAGGEVVVEFELDKALAPDPPDQRELGVMVLSLELI